MPNHRWALGIVLLLLVGSLGKVSAAADPSSSGRARFTVDVWDANSDLPQGSVIAMTQTQDGYLWLGTLGGLVRFDGVKFTVFDEGNTPGLASSRIVKLFEDGRGQLWIGTETAGVFLMKNGQIASVGIGGGSRDGRLVSICEDSTRAIWLYTADGQLWRDRNGVTNLFQVPFDGPSNYRGLVPDSAGGLWLGVDREVFHLETAPVSDGPVLSSGPPVQLGRLDLLLESRTGGHWRFANGFVQKWRTNHVEFSFRYPSDWFYSPISSACEDPDGNLLVGTLGAGLFWLEAASRFTNYVNISTNQGLSYNYVLSLLVDREGTLWVGTDGNGLNRLKRQIFNVVEPSRSAVVQSVSGDTNGGIWFGCNGDGVGHWQDGALDRYGSTHGLLNPYVWSVYVDKDQQVWAGTRGAGLFRWQDGKFHPAPGLAAANWDLTAIHQDRRGQLWLGTRSGLVRWAEMGATVFTSADGLLADEVRAIAESPDGSLWIGTRGGGLDRLRDGKFTAAQTNAGMPGKDISCLWADDDGVLWVGTLGGGLVRFDGHRWTRYTTREGLASNSPGYLVEDLDGDLWIGSTAGITRVRKKTLNDFALGRATFIPFRTYRKPDGLPTRECTAGSQPAAYRSPDGRLWFPTAKGLVYVDPAQLHPNTNPPPVVIESVLVEGQPHGTNALRPELRAALTVPAGRERVEIQYTSLNLSAPEAARFKYRLDGYEAEWTDAGNARTVLYRKLPPGSYRFQVTACNEDGVWNPTGSSLAIVVEPPFWRTWSFLAVTVAALLGSIVAIVHYFSTQKLQRQLEGMRQHEALELERARIARDIHDQLGANLTQVALLGELVESDKDSPDDVEAHARQISQTARDTTRSLDEIVWTVNPSNDTVDGLITYLCKYAQDYFEVAGLRYRLDAPAQVPNTPIPPEIRHNVFLAAKEAVTNVVRHAQATAARLRVRIEPGAFVLEIEDNGRGVAGLETKSTRNGLRNMRKRMEDVGGQFSIGPGAEGGAVVRLTVPIQR
jgi:ligand-binding sensor domain-containing protein/signal transduction histidine kinase